MERTMEKVTKIALLGLGTVGGGVYKVIQMQQEEMERKLGTRVEIKKILVRNIQKAAISKEKWWPSALLWDPAATYLYSLST